MNTAYDPQTLADDLRLYASHPNPAADYAEAVKRVESKLATEVDFDPGSHTVLLTHGAKTAKVIIFAHGYPSSPSLFKEIAAQFYDRGYNVLGQILRLSQATQALARQKAPGAGSIVVITNLNDPGVDNVVTDKVVDLCRTRWPKDVQICQFPVDLGLGHDIIDVQDPNMNVAVVYPKLPELIGRPAWHTTLRLCWMI